MAIIGAIRKHSAIAVTVIALAIGAFIIGDVFNRRRTGSTNVAKINGEDISYMEFDSKVQEIENWYKNETQKGQVSSEEMYMIRDNAWNQILQSRILDKEYKALGIQITSAEMNDMFLGEFVNPLVLRNFTDPATGEFNRTMVVQWVTNFDNLDDEKRLMWSKFEKDVKENRINSKYNSLISRGFYTPKAITSAVEKLQAKSVDTRYVVAGYGTVPENEITLTDSDYKKYYDAHKEELKQRENACDIRYVVFQTIPTPEDMINIQNNAYSIFEELKTADNHEIPILVNSESDVRYDSIFRPASYFGNEIDSIISQSSVGTFIEPVMIGGQWKMGKVLKVENRPDSLRASSILILNSNADRSITRTDEEAKKIADSLAGILKAVPFLFAQIAAEHSDDRQTAEKGGDMGWQLDEGFYGFLNEKIVSTSVNNLFVEEHPNKIGYYIVQVTGKSEPKRKLRVAMIVRDIEASDRTVKDIYARAGKFASESRTMDELVENAQKNGLMVRSADQVLQMNNSLPGVNNAREIVRWAYNKNTKIGDVAPEIFESDGSYIVVGLKDIHKKGYAALDQVKPQIEQQARNEKRAEIVMEKVKKAMEDTKDINTIASRLNTTVDTIERTGFSGYFFGKNGAEMKVLGSLGKAVSNTLTSPIKGYNGVYVLYIDNVVENPAGGANMFAQQMDMIGQQKSRMLIQTLIENTKLKDNRALFY